MDWHNFCQENGLALTVKTFRQFYRLPKNTKYLTQGDLAGLLELNAYTHIQQWESGKVSPPLYIGRVLNDLVAKRLVVPVK